jgi:hypothetical protein
VRKASKGYPERQAKGVHRSQIIYKKAVPLIKVSEIIPWQSPLMQIREIFREKLRGETLALRA